VAPRREPPLSCQKLCATLAAPKGDPSCRARRPGAPSPKVRRRHLRPEGRGPYRTPPRGRAPPRPRGAGRSWNERREGPPWRGGFTTRALLFRGFRRRAALTTQGEPRAAHPERTRSAPLRLFCRRRLPGRSASHAVGVSYRVSRPRVAAALVLPHRPRPWSLDLVLAVFPGAASWSETEPERSPHGLPPPLQRHRTWCSALPRNPCALPVPPSRLKAADRSGLLS